MEPPDFDFGTTCGKNVYQFLIVRSSEVSEEIIYILIVKGVKKYG